MPEMQTKALAVSNTERWLMSERFRTSLAEACPRDFKAVALARSALTMVRDDKYLQKCTQKSILNSVFLCAQTGLMPGPMGLAAIVPYKDQAQFQVMYKGLILLAHRSGMISAVQSEVVYECDQFDFDEGSSPYVKFRRSLDPDREKQDRIACFAAFVPKEGPSTVRVMSWDDILKVRDRYDKGRRDDRPWVTALNEMACKTVIKACGKRAPISPEMTNAISQDDVAEVGKIQSVPGAPDPDEYEYCNKPLSDDPDSTLVCSMEPGHDGECTP